MNATTQGPAATRPLEGIRVLDFSWVLAGPVAGRLLADAGAEVIKIESRKRIDNTRRSRAVRVAPADQAAIDTDPGFAAVRELFDRVPMFHNLNAGKESFAADLGQPEAIAILKQLIGRADVLLENFAPGVMQRLGLGYEVLREINPRLVMLSMSGTGQDGPMRDVPAYAPTVTALAGLDSVVGYPGGDPIGVLGLNLADSYAGLFACEVVLTALWARQRTGVGQHIDYSEMEGILMMLAQPCADYATNGRVMDPDGNDDPGAAPCGIFRVRGDDAWVALSIHDDAEWSILCGLAGDCGDCDWAVDGRWRDAAQRRTQRAELNALVGAWCAGQERWALVERLAGAGLRIAPVHEIADEVNDPWFRERGLFSTLPVPGLGDLTLTSSPWRLTRTPTPPRGRAPALGEHTRAVLERVLGHAPAEVDALLARNVLI